MILLVLAILLLIAYGILMFTYKKWWERLEDFTPGNWGEDNKLPFISVVIPARNEAQNIPRLLASLSAQTYPEALFEILLVDDHSSDQTVALAKKSDLCNLVILTAGGEAINSSKKKAIAAGVQQAKGELIICTDADCVPPPDWIQTIAAFYEEKQAAFIAAPVAYTFEETPLQLLQAIDFLTLQGITAASVSAHFHTMCNGANLAYTKEAFEEVGGFLGIDKVASGDDMLLMHKIWKRNPEQVFYLKSKEVIVTTEPMLTWKDFIQQRIRWASKTPYYEDKRVLYTLLLIYFVNLMFFVLLVAGFWNGLWWFAALCFVGVKFLIELPFVTSVAQFYNQKKVMKCFFWLQPLHMAYTVSIGFLSQMGSYEWKGRRTK